MRGYEQILRSIIRETLLQEEVYGAQAVVYHGTKADPRALINAIMRTPASWPAEIIDSQVIEGDFRPGQGAGAMYGKGLYTVYDLVGARTATGYYGPYILKLKVNLYGFIIFDPDVAVQVYGSALTPAEQAELVGVRQSVVERLKEYKPRAYKLSSDGALWASKFLQYEAKGLVYTGGNDGRCVLIYDPATVVPMAWKKIVPKPPDADTDIILAPVNTWISDTRDDYGEFRPEIRDAARRSSTGAYEAGRYDTRTETEKNIEIMMDKTAYIEKRKAAAAAVPAADLEEAAKREFTERTDTAASLFEILVGHPDPELSSFAQLRQMIYNKYPIPPVDEIVDLILNLKTDKFVYVVTCFKRSLIGGEGWKVPAMPPEIQRAWLIAADRSKDVMMMIKEYGIISTILTTEPKRDDLLQVLASNKDPVIRSKALLILGDEEKIDDAVTTIVAGAGQSALFQMMGSKIIDLDVRNAVLRMLVKETAPDKEVLRQIAYLPDIPPELLSAIINFNDKSILHVLAQNVTLPPELQAEFIDSDDSYLRWGATLAAASYPNTSPDVLDKLASKGDQHLTSKLATNPNTSGDTLQRLADQQMSRLSKGDPDGVPLYHIVRHPNIQAGTLSALIDFFISYNSVSRRQKAQLGSVIEPVCENPKTPTDALEKAAGSSYITLKRQAKSALAARSKAANLLAKGQLTNEALLRNMIRSIL